MKKYFLSAFAVLAMGVMYACTSAKSETKTDGSDNATAAVVAKADAAPGEVVELTDDNMLRPGYKAERPIVVDFNAPWCGPCRMFSPTFHNAAEALGDKVDFYSANTDDLRETATAYHISSIPAVMILKPDGSYKFFVGLNEMAPGVDLDAIETPDQLTEMMTPAFIKLVKENI